MSPANWVLDQKEAQDQGVRVTIRFADKRGKMKSYIGPDTNLRGSRAFGRAYEMIKNEALNWFVGESLDAAAEALKTLTFYLGDFAAELIKSRIGVHGDPTTPVHVYTGSMIESIAPKDSGSGITRHQRSVAWTIDIGILQGATRSERSGLPVPRPRNTGEYVANYAYPRMESLYERQDISGEIEQAFRDVVSLWSMAGGVDAMAWASIGASQLSNQIMTMRMLNQQKVLISAEARIRESVARQAGGNRRGGRR